MNSIKSLLVTSGDADDDVVLSIVCITFNHLSYIKESLESILNQRVSFGVELIVHDDASTDGTSEFLRAYFAEMGDNRCKLIIRQENQYRKAGWAFLEEVYRSARGKYIAICEGDDYWLSTDKLEKQMALFRANPELSLVMHNAIRLNCVTGEKSLFNTKNLKNPIGPQDILLKSWFAPTASFMFRKEYSNVPEKNSGINGDIYLLFFCSLYGPIHYIAEPLSVYRYFSSGSLSSSFAGKISWELYRRKWRFLNKVDERTNYKLALYTLMARGKIILSMLYAMLRRMRTSVSNAGNAT